jgi:hypothetical protein
MEGQAMPAQATRPAPGRPKLARVPGIEIFQAGDWKGTNYTEKDIDDIVENFEKFSRPEAQLVRVPLVIGHEEDQKLMKENTGFPKDGTIARVWKWKGPCRWCGGTGRMEAGGVRFRCPSCRGKGKVVQLRGDAEEIPPNVAGPIDQRRYDRVSAEIYDEDQIPEGVPATGKMLRRVACLGGDLPHVKPLAALPYTEYSERPHRVPVALIVRGIRRTATGFTAFSEVRRLGRKHSEGSMNREQMMAKLSEAGMNPEVLQRFDDAQLSEVCKLCGKMAEGEKSPPPEQVNPAEDEQSQGALYDEPGEQDSAVGDQTGVDKKAFADCMRKMNEIGKKAFGDDYMDQPQEESMQHDEGDEDEDKAEGYAEQDTGNEITPGKGESAEEHSERRGGGKSRKHTERPMKRFSESQVKNIVKPIVAAAVASVIGQLKPVQAGFKKFAEEAKASKVDSALKRGLEAGRIDPAELDTTAGLPTLRDELLAMDDGNAVHKFSEAKGKFQMLTPLDAALLRLERRRSSGTGEKVKVGPGGRVETFSEGDAQVAKVKKFAEDNETELAATGFTKAEFIKTFETADAAGRAELLKAFESVAVA